MESLQRVRTNLLQLGIVSVLSLSMPAVAANLAEDLWTPTTQDSSCGGYYDIDQLQEDLYTTDEYSTIRARANRLEFSLDGASKLEGNVVVTYQGVQLHTPAIDLDLNNYVFQTLLGMKLVNDDFALSVRETEISMTTQELSVEGADFVIFEESYRGSADAVQATAKKLHFYDVSITRCPPKNNSWLVSAREIRLNRTENVAVARDVTLNVGKLPALYIPYLRFPVGNNRISGFLPPQIESSSLRGYSISVPLYFNLAPNYDLTVTPQFSSPKNHSIAGEFRFLSRTSNTQIEVNFLPSDSAYRDYLQSRIDRGSDINTESDRRWYVGAKHELASKDWLADVDYSFVSDENYLRDFGDSIDDLGRVGLARTARLGYWGLYQDFFVSTQRYEPFSHWGNSVSKTPEIRYTRRQQFRGTNFGMSTHTARFYSRDLEVSLDSTRAHLEVFWEIPYELEWGQATLMSTRSMTRFDFPDGHEVRLMTTYLFDSSLMFERAIDEESRFFQTLEPKFILSKRTMNQVDAYPAFDAGENAGLFETIFYPTRILGYDDLDEVESLSLGLRTRLLDLLSFNELISLQFALSSRRNTSIAGATHDKLFGIAVQSRPTTSLQFSLASLQLTADRDSWTHEFRLKFEQADWRFTSWLRIEPETNLRQSYIDLAAPIHKLWNFYGRLHFDWAHDEHIESFVGAEYVGCCMEYRILWHETLRYEWVNSESLQSGSGIRVEISLKGLTSLGDNVRSMVSRGAQPPSSVYAY